MITTCLGLLLLASSAGAELSWVRARGHSENGEFVRAIEQWTKLTERFPESVQAWTSLAQTARRGEQFELAENAVQRALEIEPALEEAHWQLGLLRNLQQRPADALASFDRIHPKIEQATFHYQRGIASRALDRSEEAVIALSRAVELDENLFPARYALYLLLRNRDPARAQRELDFLEQLRLRQPDWRRNDQLRLEAGPLSNIEWPGAYDRLSIKPQGQKFQLRLKGVRAREDGLGAVIEVWTSGFLFRRSYESNPQTFFADSRGHIAVLRIVWPHGIAQNLFDVDVSELSEFIVREEIFIKGSWGGVKITEEQGG